MKNVLLFLLVFLIVVYLLQFSGQDDDSIRNKHYFSVGKNAKINIDLEGEIVINSWDLDRAEIIVETIVSGKLWGFQFNRQSRKNYDVLIKDDGEKIVIKKKPRKLSFIIGISTLKEKYRHYIHLPRTSQISVSTKEAEIFINGNFRFLDLHNQKGESDVRIDRNKLKFLGCQSEKGRISVNGSRKDKQFKFHGPGNSVYTVTSDEGKIRVYL
jgi:hypothetical protein